MGGGDGQDFCTKITSHTLEEKMKLERRVREEPFLTSSVASLLNLAFDDGEGEEKCHAYET